MRTRPIRPGEPAGVEAGIDAAVWVAVQAAADTGPPPAWTGQTDWVVLALAVDRDDRSSTHLLTHFLAHWAAWRRDPQRCTRLHFVAVDARPLGRQDLQGLLTAATDAATPPELVTLLLQAWPPLTPNLHQLDFEHGRVRLTLALGETARLLPALRLRVDSFVIDDGPSLSKASSAQQLARTYRALARCANPGATLMQVCADHRAAHLDALRAAGFDMASPATGRARYAPAFAPRAPNPYPSGLARPTTAVVVGAGVAGAAVAQALARLGVQVQLLDRGSRPGVGASGHAAGLFHGTVHPQDGRYARLFRAAALAAAAEYRTALGGHAASTAAAELGQVQGLLRLNTSGQSLASMHRLLQEQGLPADFVQALDAAAASARAGVHLQHPAWYYPGGGWLAPRPWIEQALHTPGVQWHGQAEVTQLLRQGPDWVVTDAQGLTLARAPLLVLANAEGVAPLLSGLGVPPWPLRRSRGQVTQWATHAAPALRLPLAGDGYALPLPGALLCGATRQDNDEEPGLRATDHQDNLARFVRLTGLVPPADPALWQGRVGWRLHSDDQLPIAGPLPALHRLPGARQDQCRLLQREPGLFVLTALGARGLTLAPLLARLVAAQATGTPWPLEQDLADAVDPGRWQVRTARRLQTLPSH